LEDNVMPTLKTAAVAFPIPDLGFLIEGTEGNDTLSDLISGVDWSSNDTVNGLGGNDWIYLYNGNDTANGGAGNDLFYDRGNGNDVMNGDAGADLFYVGLGNDTVNGGTGTDFVSYAASQQIVALDLQSGFAISDAGVTLAPRRYRLAVVMPLKASFWAPLVVAAT